MMSISGTHFIFMFYFYVGPGGWNDFDFIMTGGQVHVYTVYTCICMSFLYYTVLNDIL